MSFVVLLPSAAQATNLFTLGSQAKTNAIVTEASGTGYVAWDQPAANPATEPEVVLFCKIPRGGTCTAPITLPLPAGPTKKSSSRSPCSARRPGVVYVVGPRYIKDEDTLIWTSTDGGEKFSAAKRIHSGLAGQDRRRRRAAGPEHARERRPDRRLFRDGLQQPRPRIRLHGQRDHLGNDLLHLRKPRHGRRGQLDARLRHRHDRRLLHQKADPPRSRGLLQPLLAGARNLLLPLLRQGRQRRRRRKGMGRAIQGQRRVRAALGQRSDGLFMLSTDIAPGESLEAQPSAIDVRKFNETTHTFGEPVQIAKIPTSAGTLFNSGDIYENPETGFLYVAQPVIDGERELCDASVGIQRRRRNLPRRTRHRDDRLWLFGSSPPCRGRRRSGLAHVQ